MWTGCCMASTCHLMIESDTEQMMSTHRTIRMIKFYVLVSKLYRMISQWGGHGNFTISTTCGWFTTLWPKAVSTESIYQSIHVYVVNAWSVNMKSFGIWLAQNYYFLQLSSSAKTVFQCRIFQNIHLFFFTTKELWIHYCSTLKL